MKIAFIFLLFFSISLFANVKDDLFRLYKAKEYQKACHKGLSSFSDYKEDDEFVSLYAFACLKADSIDRLAIPIIMLKETSQGRTNASYFSVILMQKALLFHSLKDSYKLSSLNLPTTDYILSKVFELYSKDKSQMKQSIYTFQDEDDKLKSYKLYLEDSEKMIIEELYNNNIIKVHTYR